MHWKVNYRSGSGDNESYTTYPSPSLWSHPLPHITGWLCLVLLTLLFLKPAKHISVAEPLHLLLPLSLMFFSQTATWLPPFFPTDLCPQAILIRDTIPDHTIWQIHTAALCYSALFFSVPPCDMQGDSHCSALWMWTYVFRFFIFQEELKILIKYS